MIVPIATLRPVRSCRDWPEHAPSFAICLWQQLSTGNEQRQWFANACGRRSAIWAEKVEVKARCFFLLRN
jgi:hypothetical protein